MDVLIKVLQLLLSLSILVIIHEFGHFITAKMFKARVEKFYLFFNPWFSLFKFRIGETEYGMGWLPLGGYVKISGMIDESMDKEQMKKPPEPHEFRAKPAWQRLIIMLGGVLMNVILAALIYIFMLAAWGERYIPTSEVNRYGIMVDSLGYEMGLREGDRILSIDHKEVEVFSKIPATIILEEAQTVQVIREGEKLNIEIPKGFLAKMVKAKSPNFINFRFPFEAEDLVKDSPAERAGIQKGDILLGINNNRINYFQGFVEELQKHKGEEVSVTVLRNQKDTLSYSMNVPASGKLGIYPVFPLKVKEKHYNLAQAVPAGLEKAYVGIGEYLKQLKLMFSPEVKAYEEIGGFITIGSIFPSTWNWEHFWTLTAFLSIMLAILNVLPIPALDGGHVMFVLYEMIAGRKPSDKFLEYAQVAGMVILFGLLIYANGNDIIKLFSN